MTRAPAGAAGLVVTPGNEDAFGDRFPTQPIAVGRHQVGLVLDDQHAHKFSMLRAGAYRRHIENRIRADNITVP